LRSAAERAARPMLAWLEPAPRSLHLAPAPLLEEGTRPCLESLGNAPTARTAELLMVRTYELLPAAFAPRLAELFRVLLEGQAPALVHCSAGKDRTGFVVATILSALGVRREAVLQDYLSAAAPEHAARNRERTAQIMQIVLGRPLAPAAVAALSGVRPEFLEASLAAIDRDYGSLGKYLERAAGLDAAARSALEARFLEP
jgi:protein-tyrosine phosphatase